MSLFIIFMTLSLLISMTLTGSPSTCRGTSINCPNSWPCCKSSTMIGCLMIPNGVCCNEALIIRACPDGYTCERDGGCRGPRTGLNHYFDNKKNTQSYNDDLLLVSGFIEGLGLFTNMKTKDSCDYAQDPQVVLISLILLIY